MLTNLRALASFFLQPVQILRGYRRSNLRPDVVAGLTVAVILLPQAIAYALIADLPPQVGLYAAIVAAIVGALWGSSNHLQTGPTNAISLLILSTLFVMATPGTAEYLVLTGLLAVLVGVIQLAMGLARLGVLINFVSHSVIVGFSAGAGVLIAIQQLRHLLGLQFTSHSLMEAVQGVAVHLPETHGPTMALGLGTILLIMVLRWLNPKLPGPLTAMVAAAAVVGILGLDQQEVAVIGELPRSLPPLAKLPLLDLRLIGQLAPGALAVAAIGLVEAMSIARSIANQSGQRLDSNQEFVGQGLANFATGLLSGYPGSGSFTRSAVNFDAGAQTPLASAFSGVFVLIAMLAFAPLAAYVPRTALAGVLILTAYSMIDRKEIVRIWRGARADAFIMIATFLATLLLHLEFAVLIGILLSFAVYIIRTSVPKVSSVLPDEDFRHFVAQPLKAPCPQLAPLEILGDLYFGAVSHIEKAVDQHLATNPDQRFLLLRMHSVHQCDFSGIHALESIVHTCRERGGDVFLVRVHEPVLDLMRSIGFYDYLGADHFLLEDEAVSYLFHKVIDPAICIYECDARPFKECQNLPRPAYPVGIPCHTEMPLDRVTEVSPEELWQDLCGDSPPLVVDVREPREYEREHIPQARLIPLPVLLSGAWDLPRTRSVVLVCRGGRRSTRAACLLYNQGHENVAVLRGGLLAWEAANLLEAVDDYL
jgi:SulP family sulfate permease